MSIIIFGQALAAVIYLTCCLDDMQMFWNPESSKSKAESWLLQNLKPKEQNF